MFTDTNTWAINPDVLPLTVPIKCLMNVCPSCTFDRILRPFWNIDHRRSFSWIGWDEWGCWVMASETKWFSIMPQSKWREEAAEIWPKWAMLITSNQFCMLGSSGPALPALGRYPKTSLSNKIFWEELLLQQHTVWCQANFLVHSVQLNFRSWFPCNKSAI